ncbi:MAG: hypothetical protein H6873_07215 [Hyphomicrobiaceae bacterium]|nr:hypothetical protein [Hyphomicrobiaceae bacterium]
MMNTHPFRKMAAAALLGLMTLGFAGAASAQAVDQCVSNADANAAVRSGQILKLPQALNVAGVQRSAQVLNQQVCYVDGQLAYVLSVLESSGETRQLILHGSDGTPYN